MWPLLLNILQWIGMMCVLWAERLFTYWYPQSTVATALQAHTVWSTLQTDCCLLWVLLTGITALSVCVSVCPSVRPSVTCNPSIFCQPCFGHLTVTFWCFASQAPQSHPGLQAIQAHSQAAGDLLSVHFLNLCSSSVFVHRSMFSVVSWCFLFRVSRSRVPRSLVNAACYSPLCLCRLFFLPTAVLCTEL